MTNILLVTSSPRGDASHSSRLAIDLAERLQAARPGGRLVRRDLAHDPLPHIDAAFSSGIYTPEAERSAPQASAVAVSDAVVDEVLAADAIVIATGLINFGIASTLKSWIDHLARAGRTFRYTADGPEGLVRGKKVYLVLASGGIYSDGPATALDHAVPYMRALLAFLGMTDVKVIRIEGVGMGPDAERAALSKAAEMVAGFAQAA